MKIIVDAFGGDNAPLSVLEGSAAAVKEYGTEILLSGNEAEIKRVAKENNISLEGMEILNATDIISMHDDPTDILKAKAESSMAVGMKALAEGKGDAFVSAGSTGALVVGGTLIVKRIKGVKRPALASMIPGKNGNYLMLDIGANAECRPEMLQQFGIMGSVYMENVEGKKNPTVALLNIGTEDTKGGELQKESYALLKTAPVNFVGNVESREIPKGDVDVVVADGFTGNIALKLIEGVSSTMFSMIKGVLYSSLKNKIAALMIKKGLYSIKAKADYSEVGGAPLLGTKAPVIKAHGSSNGYAFKNAIRQAITFSETGVIEKITKGLSEVKKAD
ncbi:MAG: phosphate acyltransferase PlsX [Clostridia bacterium]|nr:phosphate acyltransferase PlsX [Clostridia bacterium]